MLFNSLDFAIFFPIVFIIYWQLNHRHKIQNLFVVIVSYIFYGWWDWRFLLLILLSTIIDFSIGNQLSKHSRIKTRKYLLGISILTNLGILAYFKYANFFIDNFATAFSFLGFDFTVRSLKIILPVGISFYTFQTMSYTIDVYRKKMHANKDFIAFAAYVSFFPQLVAGPIERASHLLPQFTRKRTFNYDLAVDGMRQILWGFFKKVVIADNCALFADQIFNNQAEMNASSLLLGVFFFSFQIYGDFSGYSDIAIGLARMLGFDLMKNFAFPYFSRDIADFWRRWHISLTTWFRDYLYIPLGGSHGSKINTIRNVFIIFLVSGFWHGANWTFIIWGLLNALYFIPLLLTGRNRKNLEIVAQGKLLPNLKEVLAMASTFSITAFAWIFFRAENLSAALSYIYCLFDESLFHIPDFQQKGKALATLMLTAFFLVVEWIGRENKHAIEKIGLNWRRSVRWTFYLGILALIGLFMQTEETPFLYFQF